MKSNLIYTSTAGMSDAEWLQFRKQGIGASEVGYIMGLSPYKSNVELFYEKLNVNISQSADTVPTFMGKYMEAVIADLWTYWQDDQMQMQANYKAGIRVRSMQRVNAYIQNPKYPHLFVSLDRRINKYDHRGNGCLEIKTLGGWEAEKWEAGVPPSHIVQVNTQMLVTGWKFAELAIFEDGRYLNVYPFKPHKGITQAIITQTTDFWKRVESARRCLTQKFEAEQNFNTRKVREIEAELQRLEPTPDASVALANFLKEKYREAEVLSERRGTLLEYELAKEHLLLKEQRKALDVDILLKENTLKAGMQATECITFGEGGRILWKNDSGGARRFKNQIKV